jgi:hypothetical protein
MLPFVSRNTCADRSIASLSGSSATKNSWSFRQTKRLVAGWRAMTLMMS